MTTGRLQADMKRVEAGMKRVAENSRRTLRLFFMLEFCSILGIRI